MEDQTFTLIRYKNDVIACVEAGWILPDTHPRGADFRMEIIGTAGSINIELMTQGISICDSKGYRFPSTGHGIELELAHFLNCVKGEESPGITGREARDALELSLAARRSAKEGLPVLLPI